MPAIMAAYLKTVDSSDTSLLDFICPDAVTQSMVKIKATVISQKGHCDAGNKVGDEITFDWDTHEIEGRLCLHALYSVMPKNALYSVMPKIYAMAQGGNVAFAQADDGTLVARHACPDGYNPLILELRVVE